MTSSGFEFTHAITRRPAASVVDGLRAVDQGTPELAQMLADHEHYVATLQETGATVIELPALDAFPDSVFVEDTALCLPEGAVLMRPGAASRAGEVQAIAPTLRKYFGEVLEISGPGYIEGGDILFTGREILVGLSNRTNTAGVAALRKLVDDWGYTVREVLTPDDVLHFKTDCSLLDARTILSTGRLADSGCFDGYEVIHTADDEPAAANTIRFNQFVLMPAGFNETANRLCHAGYQVREINNTECAKIDGGMSCLSLRFSPPAS
ncbi:MAG: arginine deiminase family protein [Granulosicoccus sp.]